MIKTYNSKQTSKVTENKKWQPQIDYKGKFEKKNKFYSTKCVHLDIYRLLILYNTNL